MGNNTLFKRGGVVQGLYQKTMQAVCVNEALLNKQQQDELFGAATLSKVLKESSIWLEEVKPDVV